jgi:hypothetical protein
VLESLGNRDIMNSSKTVICWQSESIAKRYYSK